MQRIDVKTGFLCNNNCKFCVQAHKKKFGNKNTQELKQYIRESFPRCREVVLTGGEATIRDDFFDLVYFARSTGFTTVQIQTNGRMFAYKNFCLKAIQAGATEFAVALHGHTPELHDYLTGSPGSFQQTLLGIKNLVSLGKIVVTNTVITKPNYTYLPEICRRLLDTGVSRIQFSFMHAMGNALHNALSMMPRKTLAAPFVKRAIDVGLALNAKMTTEAIPYCFMAGYETHISEVHIPKTKVFDLDYTIEDFARVRRNEGKAKRKKCRACFFDGICEGPWREYPELFGWDEFIPREKP